MNKQILANSQTKLPSRRNESPRNAQPSKGDAQPPKKKIDVSAAISTMLAYSARKNSANATPEYSTWKPATISDSPSATSNGARLVSATPDIQYTRNSGNSGTRNQFETPPDCASTISPRFRLPPAINTPTSAKPIAIS